MVEYLSMSIKGKGIKARVSIRISKPSKSEKEITNECRLI
jgi:hypothetical protein